MPERRNCLSKLSAVQAEPKSTKLSSNDLLTVAEAAAVLGIKEATIRAKTMRIVEEVGRPYCFSATNRKLDGGRFHRRLASTGIH